jgi:hypothetical protein
MMYWVIFSIIIGYFFREYYFTLYGITDITDVYKGLIMFLFLGFLSVKFWKNSLKINGTVQHSGYKNKNEG